MSGYALAFIPQGKTAKEQCYVAYWFTASNGERAVKDVNIKSITTGC